MKVDLPPGASILSADVAGEKVKPVEAPDGSRVPLLRAGFRPNGAYPVSFVFMHSGAPFARKGGSDISLPRMDVPIDLLQWEIFLPEQYKVKDFTGDAIAADRVPPAFTEGAAGGEYSALSRPVSSNYEVEQLLAGQLGGIVVDPSGSVIPNARVSVTNSATGYKMDAVTNAAGFWRVWNVPSGTVQVRVDANGFRNSVGNYVYDAQRPGAIATTLNVGAVSETVEVTAGAVGDLGQLERDAKKQAQAAQAAPSANVVNLQRRVAGVLPIAIDVPRSGTAFHFVRPLVVDEETKVSFAYKSK